MAFLSYVFSCEGSDEVTTFIPFSSDVLSYDY